MNKHRIISISAAATGMLLLILDGRSAMEGIREGIVLCLQTLIPSLFPFFVLSGMLTGNLSGHTIPWLNRLRSFCHMGGGSESFLAVGILGGYPIGAGNLYSALQRNDLSEAEANRLAVFCNNPGPAFIFGVLGPMFPDKSWVFALWFVQIISALLTGHLRKGQMRTVSLNGTQPAGIVESVNRSVGNMASVCSWVILFRMMIVFLDRWILWAVPPSVRIPLIGIMELSNGCISLGGIQSDTLRFMIASFMLSAGGICVLMQTVAVFPSLSRRGYLAGKAEYTLISIVLSAAALPLLTGSEKSGTVAAALVIAAISAHLHNRRKDKKAVAIP